MIMNTDKLYQELYPEYRDCFCVEEQLSHDEYLDKLDAKLYKDSQQDVKSFPQFPQLKNT